tara:strand:+ start:2007 stop:2414 length:408 start_codon:yes stop_codon:yes gene_type:complete
MIHLNENSAIPQYFYVTPFEARKDFVKFTNYLVSFTSRSTKTPQYFIANVILDNERYTKVQIITNTDIPTNGNIKIEGSGQYDFVIFGQNSTTNLSPKSPTIVGTLENGVLTVTGQPIATIPNITIPDNVVYYEQ